jgi:hypothetical protein
LIKVVSARGNGGEERLERDDEWRVHKKKRGTGKKKIVQIDIAIPSFFFKIILF